MEKNLEDLKGDGALDSSKITGRTGDKAKRSERGGHQEVFTPTIDFTP